MTSGIAEYFPPSEIDGAKSFVQEYHGKFLLDNEMGRADMALFGIYMFSNKKSASVISRDEIKEFFTGQLGGTAEVLSKGIYDLKASGLVTENNDTIGLTFKGVKRVREMLADPSKSKNKKSTS